jgi:hypothetical protein
VVGQRANLVLLAPRLRQRRDHEPPHAGSLERRPCDVELHMRNDRGDADRQARYVRGGRPTTVVLTSTRPADALPDQQRWDASVVLPMDDYAPAV